MNRTAAFVMIVAVAGCADDAPVNVAGSYTLSFTKQANGCKLDNWSVGDQSSGVTIDIIQAPGGADVSGQITGVVGGLVAVLLGTNQFTGRVSGRDVELLLTSTYPDSTMGDCKYKYQINLVGELNGDVLSGTLDSTTVTNHDVDCDYLENCHSIQLFNGSRPPTH